MKKIIFGALSNKEILLWSVGEHIPVFARLDNKLQGMIVEEAGKGWILRTGGDSGASGHYPTRLECMESCLVYGYQFYIELE